MSDRTREIFDDWARRGRDRGMEEGHGPRAEQAMAMLDLAPGDRVLDLGCGNGWAARGLRARVGPDGGATGLDLAPAMIAGARALSAGQDGLDFVEGPFEAMPFADASFAAAFSMEALYYAADLDAALAEIRRVLVPGGAFVFATDFYRENPHCHDWPAMMGIPMALLSEADWRARFARAGFEVVASRRCLDPRPVDPGLPDDEARALRDFREKVGALAILVRRRD